jgi:hypothetical protein
MQHPHRFPRRRAEFVAPETLMLPDRLQQFFRRRGGAIAQQIHRAALFPPHGIKVFRPQFCATDFHAAVFARLDPKVKLANVLSI